MQIIIVCLLALIAVILAPWLIGVVIAAAALYGVWVLAVAVLAATGFLICVAVALIQARKPSRMQQMINESNRLAQERDAKQGSEWKP
jgi:membrane protein implicated in regulation of membrane protease activity